MSNSIGSKANSVRGVDMKPSLTDNGVNIQGFKQAIITPDSTYTKWEGNYNTTLPNEIQQTLWNNDSLYVNGVLLASKESYPVSIPLIINDEYKIYVYGQGTPKTTLGTSIFPGYYCLVLHSPTMGLSGKLSVNKSSAYGLYQIANQSTHTIYTQSGFEPFEFPSLGPSSGNTFNNVKFSSPASINYENSSHTGSETNLVDVGVTYNGTSDNYNEWNFSSGKGTTSVTWDVFQNSPWNFSNMSTEDIFGYTFTPNSDPAQQITIAWAGAFETGDKNSKTPEWIKGAIGDAGKTIETSKMPHFGENQMNPNYVSFWTIPNPNYATSLQVGFKIQSSVRLGWLARNPDNGRWWTFVTGQTTNVTAKQYTIDVVAELNSSNSQ